jgi:hypothetical protein
VADTTPPTVSFGSPTAGATVSGTVTVQVNASDNVGVSSVSLTVDGSSLGTDTSSPYSFPWNAGALANGSHTLTATATDAAGNTASATITVTVNNPDIVPPTVSIASPAAGASVAGTVTVQVNASDNTGVGSVGLTVDGVSLGTDTSVPYSFTWNTATVANGTHTLVATATDAAGNTASATITVTVNNPTAPTVSITSPAAGATVSGTVSVTVATSSGVVKVELYVDGKLTSTSTTAPFINKWNARKASAGAHSLQCKAYDAAGRVGSSAVVTVSR